MNYLFTSESVTEGHPDKVADCISDAVLDTILNQDSEARVACETMITGLDSKKLKVIISGEITTSAKVDYDNVVNKTLKDIGYLEDYDLSTLIKPQSKHIAQGVDSSDSHVQGAGDQGLMFGFACNETPQLMPLPIVLSHELAKQLTKVRKDNTIKGLCPDGKSQVTINYDSDSNPVKVEKVVIATQHLDMIESGQFKSEDSEHAFIRENVIKYVILPTLSKYENISYEGITDSAIVNGTGRFVEGGPVADVGLTGRKIIVDTYGGYAKHGGGAFSGKDPSKVDRSAAYMTRYIAKNIVASNIAKCCEVQLAYSIGVAEPMSVNVNTFGTSKISDSELIERVKKGFDLTPKGIIDTLDLKNPIYRRLAAYGHLGREGSTWEKTDRINLFQ
ncbi:MAG: methionine adenosyltransferase [Candidatus Marinimicrobia bacterium]|nr:methionine adenosyltransferase [Candidatus Neomarinimicrobiota bacterium]